MSSETSSPVQAPEKTFRGLRNFNLVMGFMHLIQGALMIFLSNDTVYPIFTNYLRFDLSTFSLTPNPLLAYELLFGPAVAVFLLLSAVSAADYHLAFEVRSGRDAFRFFDGVYFAEEWTRTAAYALLLAWLARQLWVASRPGGAPGP